jgi:hypothetical protein
LEDVFSHSSANAQIERRTISSRGFFRERPASPSRPSGPSCAPRRSNTLDLTRARKRPPASSMSPSAAAASAMIVEKAPASSSASPRLAATTSEMRRSPVEASSPSSNDMAV